MLEFHLDPSEYIRKNAHLWHGEKSVLWYHEKLDGSSSLIVLYDYGDIKRRLSIEIGDRGKKIESKNDEISEEKYNQLKSEIEEVEKLLGKN